MKCTIREAEDRFDRWLDEVYEPVTLGNLSWAPSYALKTLDPIAYKVGLLEYCEEEGIELERKY